MLRRVLKRVGKDIEFPAELDITILIVRRGVTDRPRKKRRQEEKKIRSLYILMRGLMSFFNYYKKENFTTGITNITDTTS